MRYPNVTSLYFATPLAFNDPEEGFLCNDLRKILHGGQTIAKVQNGKKHCRKFHPRAPSRAHERYRRQTDLRQKRPERHIVTFG